MWYIPQPISCRRTKSSADDPFFRKEIFGTFCCVVIPGDLIICN